VEQTDLLESLVVTESWFFRDQEAFAALAELGRERLASHAPATLRLLSFPCASGEEPYSIAMALLDAGADQFQIDAGDISAGALERARRGVYRKNSFRGAELDFRNRYFRTSEAGFLVADSLRRKIRFFQGNILDEGLCGLAGNYDFVFCRNLLVYLDPPGRDKALENVSRLLAPDGVLFLGAAEQNAALNAGFVSLTLPMAFAYRRRGDSVAARPPAIAVPAAAKGMATTPSAIAKPEKRSKAARIARVAKLLCDPARHASAGKDCPKAASLQKAWDLASAGFLEEATAAVREHLHTQPDCAPGYFLLGIVQEAAGSPHATESYRKALYLEPRHRESLVRMALMAERNGDQAGARNYRRRAQQTGASLHAPTA
jgi:chemotaxis protein methyltransferase WspC